ncbi:unnamed protein product, partial [Rotaria sp. Silwood2]
YTTVFNEPKFCGKSQDFIFGKQCPYRNCRYTCDRNSSTFADVLLMHRSDIHFDQLPIERNPEQIWLYWHDEPGGVQNQAISYQFNWTISYRFNAEVNIGAYGLTILRNKPLSFKEVNSYINEQFSNRQPYAVWFVSNCKPKARLYYYDQLHLYYPSIKVYGDCVLQNKTNHCHRHSHCETFELSKNKFYFHLYLIDNKVHKNDNVQYLLADEELDKNDAIDDILQITFDFDQFHLNILQVLIPI